MKRVLLAAIALAVAAPAMAIEFYWPLGSEVGQLFLCNSKGGSWYAAPTYYWNSSHQLVYGGHWHRGIDIGGSWNAGNPIAAAAAGTAFTYSDNGSGYGNHVRIDHGNGWYSLYGHMASFAVGNGQRVAAGQTIGYVGCTGACTGPHVHFEIRRGENNPNFYADHAYWIEGPHSAQFGEQTNCAYPPGNTWWPGISVAQGAPIPGAFPDTPAPSGLSGGGSSGGVPPASGGCTNGDGLYCGGNGVPGDPNSLYRCSGGAVQLVRACGTCQKMPTGTDDRCNGVVGHLDSTGVESVTGWACDTGNPGAPVSVEVYIGGPAGSGVEPFSATTDQSSEAAVNDACGGGSAHRWRVDNPDGDALDGQPVFAYAIKGDSGARTLLGGSPMNMPTSPACGRQPMPKLSNYANFNCDCLAGSNGGQHWCCWDGDGNLVHGAGCPR